MSEVKTKSTFAEGQLKAFGERIVRLDEELKAINADKSEIYKEAKGSGYDVPALKSAIKKWRKILDDPMSVAEAEAITDIYLLALQGQARPETAQKLKSVAANSGLEVSSRTRTSEPAEIVTHSQDQVVAESPLATPVAEEVVAETSSSAPLPPDDDLEVPEFLKRSRPEHADQQLGGAA